VYRNETQFLARPDRQAAGGKMIIRLYSGGIDIPRDQPCARSVSARYRHAGFFFRIIA
jgi:hypothetical protein